MRTTKKESSLRQIEAAITHFRAGQIDCAITLAAAGEGILPPTKDPHIFQQLQPHCENLDLNLVINWLKHPGEPAEVGIDNFEAVIAIARGITKFIAVFHQSSTLFEEFLEWTREEGHLPKNYN